MGSSLQAELGEFRGLFLVRPFNGVEGYRRKTGQTVRFGEIVGGD
jgi:hypothetical protein